MIIIIITIILTSNVHENGNTQIMIVVKPAAIRILCKKPSFTTKPLIQ